jgi:CheY-like chemotaxis protein
VRLIAQRSGARLRRADSLAAARRHLSVYRPNVVIVDLGLPDGSGLDLLAELSTAPTRPQVLLATSGADDDASRSAARGAGADGFLPKPMDGIAAFQAAIIKHLPPGDQLMGPRDLSDERVAPDRLALSEDLAFAARALHDERVPPSYVASFLLSLARTDRDEALADRAAALAVQGRAAAEPALRALIRERMAAAPPIP